MSDLVSILQSNTGHQFICNGMPVCLPWESVGFDYLDSLGLKWYDEPPPKVIAFTEGVPSSDIFVRGVRGQWMFYWLCFDNWKQHSAYMRSLHDTTEPIDVWFRWDCSIDRGAMLQMYEAYRHWHSA